MEIVMERKKSTSKKPSLDELVFGALSQLQALHYSGRSIRRYQAIWNRLIKFADKNNFENKLSGKLIIQFLEHYGIKPDELNKSKTGWQKHAEFGLRILWEFSRYGYFERIHTLIQQLNISSTMKKTLYEYVKYCKEKRYISKYCTNERIRQISLLLDFVVKNKVTNFKQIRPEHLSTFISTLWRFTPHTIFKILIFTWHLNKRYKQNIASNSCSSRFENSFSLG
jgi:hypothetical protein